MSVQYGLDLPGWVGCDEFLEIEGLEVRCVFEPFFLPGLQGGRNHVFGFWTGGHKDAFVPVPVGYQRLVFGCSVTGEYNAVVLLQLSRESVRGQHDRRGVCESASCGVIEGRVYLHAAGVYHRDDEGGLP